MPPSSVSGTMFDTKTTWLTAPPLWNSSCSHPRFISADFLSNLSFGDVVKAFIVLLLSVGIVGANLLVICVLNSRRYSRYIGSQPRYLLTSLALNDLFIGVLVAPVAFLPALYKCWPYGEIFCQIQALLRGALSQQSAVILVCMAIDRYICLLHPTRYHRHSSKKGCVLVISITWVISVSLFAVLVLPRGGHYFNSSGLLACDPFHTRIAYRILSCCAYYFPTTMALMYCYGSGFHVNKLRIKTTEPGNPEHESNSMPCVKSIISRDYNLDAQERILTTNASRTMAAMSLGFIVVVTPATIQEVVAACTGCKVPPMLDFLVTWLALSNSFWNPFLYWLLNNHFRRISSELISSGFCCRRGETTPPLEKSSGCCNSLSSEPPAPPHKPDLEGLSEKYWGEILERTVSSTSLHALQKVYHGPRRDSSLKCNGSIKNYHSDSIKSIHEYQPRHYECYQQQQPDYRRYNSGSDFRIDVYGHPLVDYRLKNSDARLFENHSEMRLGEARSNLSLDEISFSKCNGHFNDS